MEIFAYDTSIQHSGKRHNETSSASALFKTPNAFVSFMDSNTSTQKQILAILAPEELDRGPFAELHICCTPQ